MCALIRDRIDHSDSDLDEDWDETSSEDDDTPQGPAVNKKRDARDAKKALLSSTVQSKSALAAAKNTLSGAIDTSLLPEEPVGPSAVESHESRLAAEKAAKETELKQAQAMFADLTSQMEMDQLDDQAKDEFHQKGASVGKRLNIYVDMEFFSEMIKGFLSEATKGCTLEDLVDISSYLTILQNKVANSGKKKKKKKSGKLKSLSTSHDDRGVEVFKTNINIADVSDSDEDDGGAYERDPSDDDFM